MIHSKSQKLNFKTFYSNLLLQLIYTSQTGWTEANLLPKTSDIMAISFIKILIDGPDVSLRGSPTVSPTTAALWI